LPTTVTVGADSSGARVGVGGGAWAGAGGAEHVPSKTARKVVPI
jgi:hypothetical protein